VIEILVWALPRFLVAAMPLLVALLAGQRAFLSVSRGTGRSAPVWMGFAGFACVAGASLLPWAMHLQPVNGTGLILSAVAVALWPVLGVVLRRSAAGAKAGRVPVFRHAMADDGWRQAARAFSHPPPAEDPHLPFLPASTRMQLH
jgi:hypothetical protein